MNRPQDLELLRVIDEGVAGETGDGFFRSLVVAMARALDVENAFACEFNADSSIALIFAEWKGGGLLEEVTPFAIDGTPCQLTLAGDIVAFEEGVVARYPYLADMQAESYLAIPLKTNRGEVVGHLAVIDTRPRHWRETDFGILRIFASRAAAEIERRRAERELEKALRAAERANLAKTQFLAHMSHEIRTPLNAIFGYTQLLKRSPDLAAAHGNALEQITQAGEHLLGLINELLDIAKIESGRLELVLAPTDLAKALEHVAAVARLRAEQAGLSFTFLPPAHWPPRLLLDERKLRQVILNLLNNAVQFTARGGVTLALEVQPRGADSFRLRLRVSDTGIGFEREAEGHIFEPFYRTDSAQRMAEGSGLGLAIVERLVHLMGGGITFTSTPGDGSEFVIDVVTRSADPTLVGEIAARSLIVGHAGPRRSVLVADDVRESRKVLRELLVAIGFKVVEAANGEEAVALARTCQPDLIFMDLVMPGLDGFEAVRRIRAHNATASIPIIALSASAFEDTRQLSTILGCNAFLSKPVRFEQIIDNLARELDLVWIYAEADSATAPALSAASELVRVARGVPTSALRRMLELAQQGDIVGVGAALDALRDPLGIDRDFVENLRAMMIRYDMQAIRDYLRTLLP